MNFDKSTYFQDLEPMPPTIVVIFQSPWFSAERPEILHIYSDPAQWREKIRNTKAGSVLTKVFKDLYETIIFRAANPYPEVDVFEKGASRNQASRNYSPRHIAEVFAEYDPQIVVALGESAQEGVNHHLIQYPFTGIYLFGRHPLDAGALNSLVSVAGEIRKEMEYYG
jgi:hypothetical protein